MTKRIVRLFAEDNAHEQFFSALVRRLAAEAQLQIDLKISCARGGHPKVEYELRAHQRALSLTRFVPGGTRLADTEMTTDLLLVAIDANCDGWDVVRKRIRAEIDGAVFPRHVVACPDPHIERWYMADPVALKKELNVKVSVGAPKCERNFYKDQLRKALDAAGHVVTQGGAEFAPEIVQEMDLYRAGKNVASLKHCIEELRKVYQSWRDASAG